MKKIINCMVILTMLLCMFPKIEYRVHAEENIVLGDVNDDGEVNSLDRTVLARHLAHWSGYKTINLMNADVNCDGKVNQKDRMVLARHLARWNDYEELNNKPIYYNFNNNVLTCDKNWILYFL